MKKTEVKEPTALELLGIEQCNRCPYLDWVYAATDWAGVMRYKTFCGHPTRIKQVVLVESFHPLPNDCPLRTEVIHECYECPHSKIDLLRAIVAHRKEYPVDNVNVYCGADSAGKLVGMELHTPLPEDCPLAVDYNERKRREKHDRKCKTKA